MNGHARISGVGEPQEPQRLGHAARIASLIPDDWPADVLAALSVWRQGDILEGGPLFWAGPQGDDPVLPYDGAPSPFHVSREYGEGRLIITSQTCDIGGRGPGRLHPFVSVSPVYPLASDDLLGNVRSGHVGYLVWLGDNLVADLRVAMPVSKGVLVQATPIDLGVSENVRLAFAEALAAKVRRPALHDALSEEIRRSLNGYINEPHPDADTDWLDRVEELRLRIEGDRLQPSALQLIILFDREPERSLKVGVARSDEARNETPQEERNPAETHVVHDSRTPDIAAG